MKEDTEEALKAVQKEFLIMSLLSMPGALILGVGLLGVFDKDAPQIHPMLSHTGVVYLLLAVGIVATLWCGSKLLPLEREKVRLKKLLE